MMAVGAKNHLVTALGSFIQQPTVAAAQAKDAEQGKAAVHALEVVTQSHAA
jgi:hypothetical protein